jgi:hypothetical protein
MPLDPFDLLNPTANPIGQSPFDLSVNPRPQRQPAIPPLAPDQEDSLLTSLLHNGSSLLGYVGGTLDKTFGARAIRAGLSMLGGNQNVHPSELLSFLPGSDTLGITDEKNRVSGEDLLKQAGILEGQGEKGTFEARDLAGPLAEIALDPLTYLSFGASALTKGGKIAKAAGVLPETVAGRAGTTFGELAARATPEQAGALQRAATAAGVDVNRLTTTSHVSPGIQSSMFGDLVNQPLGGHVGLHIPFTDIGTTFDLSSPLNAIGTAGRTVAGYVPGAEMIGNAARAVKRNVAGLFDRNVSFGGKAGSTQALQDAARAANAAIPEARAQAVSPVLDLLTELQDAGQLAGTNPEIRSALEGTLTGPLPAESQRAADTLREAFRQQHADLTGLGVNQGNVQNYAPRGMTPLGQPAKGYASPRQAMNPFDPHQIGREQILDLPGGTEAVNQLAKDAAVSGPNRTLKTATGLDNLLPEAAHIRRTYLEPANAELQQLRGLGQAGQLTEEQAGRLQTLEAGIKDQSERLADWAARRDPQYAAKQLDFFGNSVFQDAMDRLGTGAATAEKAKALHSMLADVATTAEAAGPNGRKLADVLEGAGLKNTAGARTTAIDYLKQAGKIPASASAGEAGNAFLGMHVPGDIAADVSRAVQGFTQPESLKGLIGAWDSITNFGKAAQTTVWPARYARNLMQEFWNMFMHGHSNPEFSALDPRAWTRGPADAYQLLRRGEPIADANRIPGMTHLTAEEASQELAKEMFARDIAGPSKLVRESEVIGQGMHAAQQAIRPPGEPGPGLLDVLGSIAPRSREELNPLNIAGVGGRTETRFAPVAGGRELDRVLSDATLGGSYINLRRQGYTPEAAAAETLKAHYDYGNLSQFEKSVMRRVFPFYSWSRQNLPAILSQLLERPGGPVGQAVRLTNDFRDQAGFVPDYLGGQLTLPIGQDEQGRQRFASRFDLPHESALGDINLGPAGVQDTIAGILSQVNPMLRAPLELAAGRQLSTGRTLGDRPGITGNVVLDELLANSPLGRFASTGQAILADRPALDKAVGLVSPMKVSTVDVERQRRAEARDRLDELLQGNPLIRRFESVYARPEDVPSLSPRDFQLLQLERTLAQVTELRLRGRWKIRT